MKILCYIYDGMADFEITFLLHRLRNTGDYEIVSISDSTDKIMAQSGLEYVPVNKIDDVTDLEDVEALIIPGGPINNQQNSICPFIKNMISKGKLVAAICFAPQFLGRAGVLKEYKYTTSCSENKIKQLGCDDPFVWSNYIDQRVVVDRNVITAQGYAFVDFAETVCDYLSIFKDDMHKYEQIERVRERNMNRSVRTSAKALVIKDGRMLAVKLHDSDGDFYIMPGGGQVSGELLPAAVKREVAEETGISVEVKDALFVIEGAEGEKHHRVDVIYLCDYIGESDMKYHPDKNQVGYEWLEIATLNKAPLYPSKLRRAIMNYYKGEETPVYLGNENVGDPEITD